MLQKKVDDENILWLINQVIDSFPTNRGSTPKGIPLGNLTSQIFVNIYLNELDQFIKYNLKAKYYLRYADDFLLLDKDRNNLYRCIDTLKQFLKEALHLELHPKKIILRKLNWGIDFCGYIVLPHYILPRTKTKRRIFKKIVRADVSVQSLQSYMGFFSHANSYRLTQILKNQLWFTAEGE